MPLGREVVVIAGATGGVVVDVVEVMMVNVTEFEFAPEFVLMTETFAVPGEATSELYSDAFTWLLLTCVVGRALPFHKTTDFPLKLAPLTASVTTSPAGVRAGLSPFTTGVLPPPLPLLLAAMALQATVKRARVRATIRAVGLDLRIAILLRNVIAMSVGVADTTKLLA